MTPPHGTNIDDSGERPAAGGEHVTRDAMKVAILNHEADCDLKEKVENMHMGMVALTSSIKTWGRAIAGAVSLLTLAVAILGLLQMREKSKTQAHEQSPSLINQAHAAPKGTP